MQCCHDLWVVTKRYYRFKVFDSRSVSQMNSRQRLQWCFINSWYFVIVCLFVLKENIIWPCHNTFHFGVYYIVTLKWPILKGPNRSWAPFGGLNQNRTKGRKGKATEEKKGDKKVKREEEMKREREREREGGGGKYKIRIKKHPIASYG